MIKVHSIPILQDNYCFLVENPEDHTCAIVDPGEAEGVIKAVKELKLKPVAIWNTHHHGDHVEGNAGILKEFGDLPVIGSAGDKDKIPQLTQFLKEGDRLEFAGETAEILEVPGHTLGHIAIAFPGHIFAGDLVFGYSCGAVFEGTMEQMYESVSKLLKYPDDTLLYIGHEYTLNNVKWAQHVDPENADIQQRVALETSPPTVPLQLGLEKRTNHFMRCHDPKVQAFTGKTEPAEVFGALRTHKNSFK